MTFKRNLQQPIDRVAIALIIFLTFIIGLLIWGDRFYSNQYIFYTWPKVSNFSWDDKIIGGEDRAFILTFNRPMDRASVEQNLVITPTLTGKISWSGLKLAYTLDKPAPYGETYQISLAEAKDGFSNRERAQLIQPFQAQFSTRDRAFAYIGTQGEETGRLVLFNWTQQQKELLTPKNLTVFDFQPYPQGDRLLFSAADSQLGMEGVQHLKLYNVATDLNSQAANSINPQVELVLDAQEYQNNKFDLAQDGKTIVVQRVNRNDYTNYGLWKITADNSPQLITEAQVGDFLITPDSQAVAAAQGEGITLLPLKTNAEYLDFIPSFGQVLDFTADGTGAAMINYNTDNAQLRYTRSLFYVTNQGIRKELLNTEGSIQDCQFDSDATYLYCWLTELEKTETYIEKPYLAKINLKTEEATTLVSLPKYQDSKLSIAPDGLGILYQQSLTVPTTTSNIWLLILASKQQINEQLPFVGLHPQWLP